MDKRAAPIPAGGLLAGARRAERRTPLGVARQEGLAVVAMASVLFVMLAVTFQARTMAWGGIVGAATALAVLVALPVLARVRRDHERVHPRGHGRRILLAGAWGVAVTALGGLLWRSGLVEVAGPVWLTTLVAAFAVAPLAGVGTGLLTAGR